MTREVPKTVSGLLAGAGLAILTLSMGCSQDSSPRSGGGSGGFAPTQGGLVAPPPASGGTAGVPATSGNGGAIGTGGGSGGAAGAASTGGAAGAIGGSGGSGAAGSGGTAGSTGSGGTAGGASAGTTTVPTVTGGAGNTGGTGRAGGTTAAGGIVQSGGTSETGGSKASGGATAAGGTSAAGGSSTDSGVPVAVTTIDIKSLSGCPGLRLGDINGDGRMEIVMAQPTNQDTLGGGGQIVVCITAFDLKGKQLWQYGKPGTSHTASSDIPVQVYDLDGDGAAEVFAAMDTKSITVIDGATGKLKRTIPLPASGSNDCITFANLSGKAWPQDIIVKTRYSQFWAMTSDGTQLWTHKGITGHYPLVYDWDGDGKDEVMGGYDFLDSDGTMLWTIKDLSPTMHADAIATADLDANKANGYEIIVGSNVAGAYDWKTGKTLWLDKNTVENQQIGIGDYRPDLPGLEVVLLDRIGPRNASGVDANVLLDAQDNLLWKEKRTVKGWMSVTENMNNWDGKGSDMILTYRRGLSTYPTLYDGTGKAVATFPYPGTSEQDFAAHADLCGDGKEEVIVYNEQTLVIYANGGCRLDDPPAKPSQPQQFHLYNWSIYSGWINPDMKFYTPGSKQ